MSNKPDPNQETPSASPPLEDEKLKTEGAPDRGADSAPMLSPSTTTHPSIKNN